VTPLELREWRAEMGWPQSRAAAELGIVLRTYKYLEAGKTSGGKVVGDIPRAIELACAALRCRQQRA
jgi:DNA-binding XRE family transcriptional regulator